MLFWVSLLSLAGLVMATVVLEELKQKHVAQMASTGPDEVPLLLSQCGFQSSASGNTSHV